MEDFCYHLHGRFIDPGHLRLDLDEVGGCREEETSHTGPTAGQIHLTETRWVVVIGGECP